MSELLLPGEGAKRPLEYFEASEDAARLAALRALGQQAVVLGPDQTLFALTREQALAVVDAVLCAYFSQVYDGEIQGEF